VATPTYRVFLSHSSKDKPFVHELYRRLTRDGVTCFLDEESIEWGENWVRALERGVDECEHMVFVLTPHFIESKWVELERTSSLADDPENLKRKARLLMREPCKHLPSFPRFFKPLQSIDVSTDELFEKHYPKICRELGGIPQPHLDQPDRSTLPPVSPLPARHRMPHRSLGDNFIGRVETLWQLHDTLHLSHTAILQGVGILAGTGGLGKTQLAVEYAHRFGASYTGGVYWVNADQGPGALITQISTAAALDLNTKAEPSLQLEELWRKLNSFAQPILIILDNFPEAEALQPYLPTATRAHTLITTRRKDLNHASIALKSFSLDEGLALLNSGNSKFTVAEAKPLLERLGGLPLAIELAKGFLNARPDLGIAQVQAEMNATSEIEVLKHFITEYRDQLPTGHELDVAKTFDYSWRLLSPSAHQTLRVIGELAPAPVPVSLLRSILNIAAEQGLNDPLAKDIADLTRLSLVELDDARNPVAHRLILAFVRHRNAKDCASPAPRCAEVLKDKFSIHFKNPDAATMRDLEWLLPHAEATLTKAILIPELAILLASGVAAHHIALGRYQLAKSFSMLALDIAQRSYASGHSSIATSQSNLAMVLKNLGELDEAQYLLRQALHSDERSYVAGHPSIAIGQSNLALVLQDLGELGEARELLRQTLLSAERSYAAGHPWIAIGQSNLAMVLKDFGELGEARDLLRQALQSDELSYAPGHQLIASSQSNLALVLQALGELGEARDLLRQALQSAERSFAAGHPLIATTQSNLALVLKDLGELGEARDLLTFAYTSSREWLGEDHPNTKTFNQNLDSLSPA